VGGWAAVHRQVLSVERRAVHAAHVFGSRPADSCGIDAQFIAGATEQRFLECLVTELAESTQLKQSGPPKQSLGTIAAEISSRGQRLVVWIDEFYVLAHNEQISRTLFPFLRERARGRQVLRHVGNFLDVDEEFETLPLCELRNEPHAGRKNCRETEAVPDWQTSLLTESVKAKKGAAIMPDIQVTDQLDKPVETIKIDLTHPSSLVKYLKTELLHLAVVPDFLAKKNSILSQAAPKPIQFQAKAQHKFQLGNTKPEIEITPSAQATIRVNASPGTNLFDADPFHAAAKVPDHTGYVSVGFQGSLDLGVSGSDGDLTFGFDKTTTLSLEYLKAFPLGVVEPTLGDALGRTLSSYDIPADLSDLEALSINDIATVSGQGSLKVSGGVKVTASPNPLASVGLPLGAGSIAVKAGATAGLSASFTISGSYQLRARRKDADTIELSFFRESGTTLKADFSVSAGITAKLGDTDLIATVLGAISTDPTGDKNLLADLQPKEIKTLSDAIKGGLDHSLQASVDAVLSSTTDDQAAFQYEIQPAQLSPGASVAVHKALDGDLSLLTVMEDDMSSSGVLGPGVKMLNSVLSETRKRGLALKINLLGILNYLTVSELIRNSETLRDNVTGDVTIKETVTGNRIAALVEPMRSEALRKVIFESVLATTSYRAGKAVAMDLDCEEMHFALNQNTNQQIMGDYLRWFIALQLLTAQETATILSQFIEGGPSTCVLRTSFGDADCVSMFFDERSNLRERQYYLELGRAALRALLDPDHQTIDHLRYQIVDDKLWTKALEIGANVNLGPLVGLSTADARVEYLIGDVMVITDWAEAMVKAGTLVSDVRTFVGNADPTTLFHNNEFKKKRDALQEKLATMIKASKTRFDEPWGMVSLFWAGGSPHTAYGKTVTQKLTVERGAQPDLATPQVQQIAAD
jgi:hypothetical protein